MVGVKGFRDLLSKIRLAWVSLILSVKNLFQATIFKSHETYRSANGVNLRASLSKLL